MSSLFLKSYICIHQVHFAQSTGDNAGRAARAQPDVLPDREEVESPLQAPGRGGINPDYLRHAFTIMWSHYTEVCMTPGFLTVTAVCLCEMKKIQNTK